MSWVCVMRVFMNSTVKEPTFKEGTYLNLMSQW
jgi:hypothetical protein